MVSRLNMSKSRSLLTLTLLLLATTPVLESCNPDTTLSIKEGSKDAVEIFSTPQTATPSIAYICPDLLKTLDGETEPEGSCCDLGALKIYHDETLIPNLTKDYEQIREHIKKAGIAELKQALEKVKQPILEMISRVNQDSVPQITSVIDDIINDKALDQANISNFESDLEGCNQYYINLRSKGLCLKCSGRVSESFDQGSYKVRKNICEPTIRACLPFVRLSSKINYAIAVILSLTNLGQLQNLNLEKPDGSLSKSQLDEIKGCSGENIDGCIQDSDKLKALCSLFGISSRDSRVEGDVSLLGQVANIKNILKVIENSSKNNNGGGRRMLQDLAQSLGHLGSRLRRRLEGELVTGDAFGTLNPVDDDNAPDLVTGYRVEALNQDSNPEENNDNNDADSPRRTSYEKSGSIALFNAVALILVYLTG